MGNKQDPGGRATTALLAAAVGAAIGQAIWIGSGFLTPEPGRIFAYLAHSAWACALVGLVLWPFLASSGSTWKGHVALAMVFGVASAMVIAALTFTSGSIFRGPSDIVIHLLTNWLFVLAFVVVFAVPFSTAGLVWVLLLGRVRRLALVRYHRRDGPFPT